MSSKSRSPIPFVVVAPLAVLTLGTAVVLTMTFLGLHELKRQTVDAAELKGRTLTHALLPRLADLPDGAAHELVVHASSTSHTTLLYAESGALRTAHPAQPLADNELTRLLDAPLGAHKSERPHELIYVAGQEPSRRLIALIPVSKTSLTSAPLVTSLFSFAILLLAAGGFVAWALARDVHADVLYVGARIVDMAEEGQEQDEDWIPVRTIDQVGQLTASFNMLLARFHAAERAYRQDLSEANAFDRDRSAFLSALSHELRNPLNAILGFAGVLLSEIDGPLSEEARENLTIVRTSGEHLRSLIDDILALSAMESGEFRLSPEQLDLYQVAQDVVTEARVTAEQKGLRLELVRDETQGPTVAFADRRRMRQVLGNVVNNAVKFTSRGEVRVTLTREGELVVIQVADTGPGISADALDKIFDEFEQSTAGTAQRTGTGLGLAITRSLVQLHGGRVRVDSALGEGSCFSIEIPIEAEKMNQPLARVSSVSRHQES